MSTGDKEHLLAKLRQLKPDLTSLYKVKTIGLVITHMSLEPQIWRSVQASAP